MADAPYQWTNQAVQELKRLHKAGLTARQIAGELPRDPAGNYPTRNAVIGKCNREGLAKRRKPPNPKVNPRRDALLESLKKTFPARANGKRAVPADIQVCTIQELNHRTCRWPLGDFGKPVEFYCGAERWNDSVYCEHHTRMAWRCYNPAA